MKKKSCIPNSWLIEKKDSLPFTVTVETKIREFQYKILNDIIYTKYLSMYSAATLIYTLLLVAAFVVYYTACLSAILISSRVQNAAATLVVMQGTFCHITPAQCSISCIGFLSHFVLILRFYF